MKKLRYVLSIIRFGNKYAVECRKMGDTRSKTTIVCEMVLFYLRYGITVSEYFDSKIGTKSAIKKEQTVKALYEKHLWDDYYDNNWKFLVKYSGIEWQNKRKKRQQRKKAYIKRYKMGSHCKIQYGVMFISEHHSTGKLKIGDYVMFTRNVDIDYTGDLTIRNNVNISEGTKILTHNHDIDFCQRDTSGHSLIKTPLVIQDNVGIGAHAIIMPGVSEIGRRAMIASGAVVKRQVPPYAIVMGNPARVVGFRYPPAVIAEFEEENYPEKERIPIEVLEENYNKYYLSKLTEIKSFFG